MNTPELVDWQRIDPENGICEPWWTWPCMDVIKTWDLKDKIWLEFGAGLSSSWLRSKCKWVDSIEASNEWAAKAAKYCLDNDLLNGVIYSADLPDGIQERRGEYFRMIPMDKKYDIISVDGIWRNESLQWAIDHFKGREGKLIVDNLNQDFVWISPAAIELMAPYHCTIFYQPGHTNHEGLPWNTRVYTIPA